MNDDVNRVRIRSALKKLDALVVSHPELQGSHARARLGQWLEDEMVMAQAKRPGVFVRMDEDLIARVDKYVERLAREQPGTIPTRSDAIRVLLYKGLEAAGESLSSPTEEGSAS